MGSLVARDTYIDYPALRPDVAAIITVTAPHQGAPLADNWLTLRSFLRDMQRRIEDGVAAASVEAIVWDMIFGVFAPKGITGFGPALFGFILYKFNSSPSIDLTNLDQFGADTAFVDLKPNSVAITHLNNRFDDGSIPRANVVATIPFRNAALRLLQSAKDDDAHFPDAVRARDHAQEGFSLCKWGGYVTIVMWTAGRRCAYARKTLGRLDDRWAAYVNGWDQYGNVRFIPFDGVVPNERSHYPSTNGAAFERPVNLTNHLNVYKTQAGLNQVANAMRDVHMHEFGPPPPPPTITAAISGPDAVNYDWYSTWSAEVSGGTPPYTYGWSGLFYGSGSSISGSTSSSGTLKLDVYDAVGVHANTSKWVTATGCGGQYLC
jgi:hypothetical protein